MPPHHRIVAPAAALIASCALAAPLPVAAFGPAEVGLAQAPAAEGTPRPTVGVGSGALGRLPFHLSLTHSCPAGSARAQLFVAIADSSVLVDAGAAGEPRPVTLEVPLRQLQWLAQPAAACRTVGAQRPPDDVGTDGLRYFRLHAGTTGFATVACSDADGRQATATTSLPLDIWLSCPAAPAP